MANVVKEFVESRDIEKTGENPWRGRRVFHVWNTATPITMPSQVTALFGTATTPDAMPDRGTKWPNEGATEVSLWASDPRIERVSGHTDLWRVEWVYLGFDLGGDEPGPEDPEYTELTLEPARRFFDFWRTTDMSVPAGGNVDNENETDIAGKKADSAGTPVTELIYQEQVIIVEVFEGSPSAMLTRLGSIRAAIGRRNSAVFEGAAIGSLLYLPPRITRIGLNKFNIPHTMLFDEFFHMRQICARDSDGFPLLTEDAKHAATVYWRQPFPDTIAFATIGIPSL